MQQWSADSVVAWVSEDARLPQLVEVFRSSRMDGAALRTATEQGLQAIGVSSLLHR